MACTSKDCPSPLPQQRTERTQIGRISKRSRNGVLGLESDAWSMVENDKRQTTNENSERPPLAIASRRFGLRASNFCLVSETPTSPFPALEACEDQWPDRLRPCMTTTTTPPLEGLWPCDYGHADSGDIPPLDGSWSYDYGQP